MNKSKFQLVEFHPTNMVENPAIVMIAKRGTGKSFVTRDIMYHLRKIPAGVVISPTDRMSHFYKNFFPDLYTHFDITNVLLAKILQRQTEIVEKMEVKKKLGKSIDPRAILVMDDCLSKKASWAKDESILEILMNGRHYKLTYILTMQTPLGITPDLRLNFDYVFLLKDDSITNKKKLYDNYASMFPNLTAFEVAFAKCTEDFRCMVIDNRKPSTNIQEKVFWYKAAEPKGFGFGSEEFKAIHKKYFNPRYKEIQKNKLLGNILLGGSRKKKGANDVQLELIR